MGMPGVTSVPGWRVPLALGFDPVAVVDSCLGRWAWRAAPPRRPTEAELLARRRRWAKAWRDRNLEKARRSNRLTMAKWRRDNPEEARRRSRNDARAWRARQRRAGA